MPHVALEAKAALEDARRTQILEAAARVFARRGFERATITEIAKAAHLAEGSLYNYFRSKEELLIHIPQQLVRPTLSSLQLEQIGASKDLAEVERVLVSVAGAAVERMRAHARFLRVFTSALPYLSPAAREKYMRMFPTHVHGILEQFLRDGKRRGLFRRGLNPAIAARCLPGMLTFFVLIQEVMLGRPLTVHGYDEIVPEVVAVFMHGVASQTDARGRRSGRVKPRRAR